MPSLEARVYTAARRLIAEDLPRKVFCRDLATSRDWVATHAVTEALNALDEDSVTTLLSDAVELGERIATELLPELSGVNLHAYVTHTGIVVIDLDVETFPEYHVATIDYHGDSEDEGEATATLTAAGWETIGPWLRSFYGGDIYTRVIRTTNQEN